jgi:tetratricopeptide (TPR) repeat protein
LETALDRLAQALRSLWKRSGVSEGIFAKDYLGISRSHFANLVNGRYLPGQEIIERCAIRFPDEVELLRNLYHEAKQERHSKSQATPEKQVWRDRTADTEPHTCTWPSDKTRRSFVSALNRIQSGSQEQAARALRTALQAVQDQEASGLCLICMSRAWRQLGEIYATQGNLPKTEESFTHAIKWALANDDEAAAVHYTDRLAAAFMRRDEFEHAIKIVSTMLRVRPRNGRLWRRFGVVRWYEGLLLDAYAALSLALSLGVPKPRIYHARGQVLAELGSYGAAVAELTEAIELSESQDNIAYARSTRAYAFAGLGDYGRAMQEFSLAEAVTPENSWLHYFRAICYDKNGKMEEAITEYRQALHLSLPQLNKPKRDYVEHRLRELGEDL